MKRITFTLFLASIFIQAIAQTTEKKDDAGQSGSSAHPGFFETLAPVNYPSGASGWWHLLDVRHSNNDINFSMQFSGSFFDQQLFFRKTNNSPTTPWSRVLLESGGKVGLNGVSPRATLDMGTVASETLTSVFGRLPEGDGNGDGTYLGIRTFRTQPANVVSFALEHQFYGVQNTAINFYRGSSMADGYITFTTLTGKERMRIDPHGNIGIGTASPQSLLAVNGTITAQRVKVTATGWPDFVFSKSYVLPSLDTVEAFISRHQHLPDIPSAATIEKEGMDVAAINTKLMQKIEELTLYLIELKKEVETLKKNQQKP
ncbi:hypothetical protein HGH92_31705 [Chitinophaga varians]|uniref:Tail fiber domain-containing protein n=1 Tax=Chitinophaga varians TaxID=2202339 RepID=A0A847RTH6_9BACT|nr:hypothetical protein [Chitinophaga varians]NLR68910.1 hypothetical protein [Chitinophaga varians]